jgi:hypothetical protein
MVCCVFAEVAHECVPAGPALLQVGGPVKVPDRAELAEVLVDYVSAGCVDEKGGLLNARSANGWLDCEALLICHSIYLTSSGMLPMRRLTNFL